MREGVTCPWNERNWYRVVGVSGDDQWKSLWTRLHEKSDTPDWPGDLFQYRSLGLGSEQCSGEYHNFKEGLIGIKRDKGKACVLGKSRYALRLPNNYCVLLSDNWPLSKLRILSAVEDN